MVIDVLYQKKEELAGIYLEDLKKELGTLQGRVVDLLAKRLKGLMTSETTLNTIEDMKLTASEKQLAVLSPATAEKIFAFVKEKQEKLAGATTIEELEILKEEMTTSMGKKTSGSRTETVIEGSAVGAAALGMDVAAIKKINTLKEANKIKSIEIKTPKEFAEKMKRQFVAIARDLDKQSTNPHLVAMQRKNIMQSAREFKNISAQIDEETMTSVGMLSTLKDKLPVSVLKSITPKDAEKLWKLSDASLQAFKQAKSDAEAISILEKQGIKGLNKEVISVLKSAENVTELKSMVTVMENTKGVLGFLRGMKGILAIDIIMTGINIFTMTNELSEAETYKKINELRGEIKQERARVQFGTTTTLMALETIGMFMAFGSSLGPVGTVVGLVVGAATYAVTQAIDVYYDKVEFYSQNQEDFKQQYRTELKEAIISSAASEEWNLNMMARVEVMYKKTGAGRGQRHFLPYTIPLTEKDRITTTEDAWKSLIRQEEKDNYPLINRGSESGQVEDEFKKTLSANDLAEYEKEKTAINAIIDMRMAYIKKFMYKDKTSKEYQLFVSAMKSSLGIKMIEKILANSKVYYDMKQTGDDQYATGCSTVGEYKAAYAENLKADNAIWFSSFETMRAANQYQFLELYYGVMNYDTSVFEPESTNESFPYIDKVSEMKKRIDFVKHYYQYKMLGVSVEDQKKMMLGSITIDNNQIQEMLTSGNLDAAFLNLNSTDTKKFFMYKESQDRMNSNLEVSDSVGQNIIYRIAVEFHGYTTGDNDMADLIAFFREDKGEALGLYYNNKRVINNDRAIDKSIDIDNFDNMTAEEILKERISPNNRNRALELLGPGGVLGATGGYGVFGFMDNASMIDTKADAGDMDDKMNAEYLRRLKNIIVEEKGYKLPENKKKIEQSIVDFIQKNSREVGKTITYDPVTKEVIHSEDKEQGYVEIPYYLVIQAQKAGIGDLRKFLFKFENNQIVACTSKLYLAEKLDFSQTKTDIKKEYVSGGSEHLGENAQKYVDYVDTAKKQFENLITFDDNELDIPKEYLDIYKKKFAEREMFKQSLLISDPATAKSELETKYQGYHDYFENTYMAMLSVVSGFTSGNDLDDALYMQQVLSTANSFTQSATLTPKEFVNTLSSSLKGVQKLLFLSLLKSQKIGGKTLISLLASQDSGQQEKVKRIVKQLVKSISEATLLTFDGKNTITDIASFGMNNFVTFGGLKSLPAMEKLVKTRWLVNLDKKQYPASLPPLPDPTDIDISKIEIKSLPATGKIV